MPHFTMYSQWIDSKAVAQHTLDIQKQSATLIDLSQKTVTHAVVSDPFGFRMSPKSNTTQTDAEHNHQHHEHDMTGVVRLL